MEWYSVGASIIVLLVVCVLIGVPIPFALAGASTPFLFYIQGWDTALLSIELMTWSVWVNYIFVAVPLFLFLGELVGQSIIGERLYSVLHRSLRIRGAAAYGSVGACAGFGAVCGASIIGALTIGSVALKQMLRLGYSKQLATGTIAAGGTLSVLIPPSLIMIYYGLVTEVSIGDLFIAGIVPGLIATALFVVVVLVWKVVRPAHIPATDTGPRAQFRDYIAGVLPVVVVGAIIVVSIYAGIATPTEAGAVAALVTLIFAITVGRLRWSGFLLALKRSVRTMGYLSVLLAAAMVFGFVLNYYRIPQEVAAAFVGMNLPREGILALVLLVLLFLGLFMEPASLTFIALPVLYPLIQIAGYDPIWFGIVFTIMMEVAALTPPVGLNLYVVQGLAANEVTLSDVVMGSLPFVASLLVLIGLLCVLPQLALWLPLALK